MKSLLFYSTKIKAKVLAFIESLHMKKVKNYLLKCPRCKKPTLVYFRVATTKLPFFKKVRSLLRHEYLCTSCNMFTPADQVISLELQKGDAAFVDDKEIKRKKDIKKAEKMMEEETKKGVYKLFGTSLLRTKKELPKYKLVVKKREKRSPELARLERDIERYDERDFADK